MKRDQLQKLIQWKNKKDRKPLIINGARQVGKTWLLKEFGKSQYDQCAYINFETSKNLSQVLEQGYDIKSILTAIQIETGIKPESKKTLLIFDEIQLNPRAITALKYFYENANEYHITCAGSLLGIAINNSSSFPVGKVEFLDMYPLSFSEFLDALGHIDLRLILENNDWNLINAFRLKLQELLKTYYLIGGMPEAVADYCTNQSLEKVRDIQKNILRTYELDFSKHAPPNIVPRIRMLWNSIPSQLAKENKKFIYKAVKEGSRAKDYELALHWLIDAGLVHKICNISTAKIPLKAYEEMETFKLYLLDVGLLGTMVNLDLRNIDNQGLFVEFKGAIAEQYVLQQLVMRTNIYYWSQSNLRSEIDFVFEYKNEIWPLEVKSAENLQAKSLKVYYEKFKPKYAIRTSLANYRNDGWLVNIPLVNIGNILNYINEKSE